MRCGVYVRVSTDDQRDNGYSIDSQLRMIKEYCEKNEYDIVDVYNDAGHSGKDLMRPEMQRLLKDIKSKKIDKLVAIKVDRLTRNNYDGFWLLNYCDEHDVKIELILEPYDVSTANGEMIFGINLVFGQRERKEIGARTKRAMEEMALERIHPSKAPYGYIRNKETGHLEVEPIEAEVVKEIFELCKQSNSTKSDDVKDIEKAIEKLKLQEKRLVDLYLSSNLDVETINHKNDVIKKEIDKLTQKKVRLDPDNNSKEYSIELVKKLDCTEKNNTLFFTNIKNIGFTFLYDLLSREAKSDMIHRLISMIEIKRDKNYNIEIKDIKFTDEFITKSSKEYLKYLNIIMNDNNIGIKFHKEIDEIELKNMESNYDILSIMKMKNKEYSNKFLEEFITKSQEHLYIDGIVSCPYTEKNVIKDILILVPKNELINTI